MKKAVKAVLGLMMVAVLICSTMVPAYAIDIPTPLKIKVNENRISFPDAGPYLDDNGRIQVPVRFVSEALGAKVEWNAATKTVIMTKGEITAKLTIGSKNMELNGKQVAMDTAAVLSDGRTFVPVRYVAEAFGGDVAWDKAKNTVGVTLEPSSSNITYEDVGGYLVNKDSKVMGRLQPDDPYVEFMLFALIGDNAAENAALYQDMRYAIESKFGKSVADEVYNHLKQKETTTHTLLYKEIYIKEADQWIKINSSFEEEYAVKVSIYRKGVPISL